LTEYLQDGFIIIIIFIFTFEKISPEYGLGPDSSYMWAFNWLFAHDYDTLIKLNYPIGPLGFILFPQTISDNLLISALFYSFINISFITLLLKLAYEIHEKRLFSTIIIIFGVSFFWIY
jgi:hypothetical protein